MSADTPKCAVHEIPVSTELREAAASANAAFSLDTAPERIRAYFQASQDFAKSYAGIVAAQLSPQLKIQILLAGASALMWADSRGPKPSLEQFIEFLTDFPADAQQELSWSLRDYMLTLGGTHGLDTTDLKPN